MKKLLMLVPALLFGFILMAQPPEGPADKGMLFGKKTSADGAIAANDVNAKVKGAEHVQVKITGKVKEVCKAEGCWLKMETVDGDIMIRMKDHSFFVPVSMEGKTIVAEGIASVKETSVAQLKHYAEDAGKSQTEIDAIKEPKKAVTLQATGILVM